MMMMVVVVVAACAVINAERCAMSATQFRRPQEKVRAELFENLQTKFPKKSARGIARYRFPLSRTHAHQHTTPHTYTTHSGTHALHAPCV